jgi:hypothetical protein
MVMPHSIAEMHDNFLYNYVKNIGKAVNRDSSYLFFAKQKTGFIVPLKRHLKLE